MPPLRLALATGALLIAAPVLSSCGFDYPTERVNNVGAGVSDRGAVVDVTGVAIVSGAEGSGNLIGTLSNNDEDNADTLVSVTGEASPSGFEPVDIPAGGYVNLATLIEEDQAIEVSGDFAAGDFVEVTFEFENSDSVTLNVPVDKPCYKYDGLAPESSTPDASESDLYECAPSEAPEAPAEH